MCSRVDHPNSKRLGKCLFGLVAADGQSISWDDPQDVSVFNNGFTDEVNLLQVSDDNVLVCYVDSPGGTCQFGTFSSASLISH